MKHFFFYLIFFFFVQRFALAQSPTPTQQIVIEATRIQEEKIEPSRSAMVIDRQQILEQNTRTLADVLHKVAGVEVLRQGAIGQTTSVFVRGARSEDTLVLIDGIEANDAMAPSGGFDFSTLLVENVERIEIYRGPQTVRFGAGALGGVINIVTQKGRGPIEGNYLGEMGSYQSNQQLLVSSGRVGAMSYSLSAHRLSTQGFSAAVDDTGTGKDEADGADVQTLSSKLAWNFSRTGKVENSLRYSNAKVEIDLHGGRGGG